MATEFARAITALVALTREVETRQQDRRRLRDASEQVALILLELLRVGDEAAVGQAVYRLEQITWPEADASESGPRPHGARALLRDDKVLVAGERGKRGRVQPLQLSGQLGRRNGTGSSIAYDLRPASDEDRLAFAREIGGVIEAFRDVIATESGRLRLASAELVDALVELLA